MDTRDIVVNNLTEVNGSTYTLVDVCNKRSIQGKTYASSDEWKTNVWQHQV